MRFFIRICDAVANGLLAFCVLVAIMFALHVGQVPVTPIVMLWLTVGSLAMSAMFHVLSQRLRAWDANRRQP